MALEDLDLKKFKEYTRRERTCNDVCDHFGLNILEFNCIINRLKTTGINILISGFGEDATVLNLDERNLNGDNIYTIDIGNDTEFNTLVISDTRLGSKYQQLSRLNFSYLEAYRNGFDKAILAPGHFNLEEPGMKYIEAWIDDAVKEHIDTTYVQAGDMYTYL